MAWAAVDPTGDRPVLAIGAAKAEHHLCQQIPGCNYDKATSIWRVPLTWAAYVCFRTVWASQPVSIHPKLEAWGNSQYRHITGRYEARSRMDATPEMQARIAEIESNPDVIISMGGHLRPYQRGGVDWLVTGERVCLQDPQGNGKMIQCIRALQVLARNGEGLPALVIAPGAALLNWRDKLASWAPELTVRVVTGTALKRRRALMDEGEADVYLIAWPNVRMHTRLANYPGQRFVRCGEHGGVTGDKTAAQCEVHPKELNEIRWGTVIADEAHRMKDARSKQTRAVWWLAGSARYFWPCTGTPIADNISDIWPAMHAIDPAAFPSRSRFLDLFAIKNMAWGRGTEILDIRPDTADAFHLIVQPWVRRIPQQAARPDEHGRLEPEFRYPEMTPAQSRAYKALRKEAMADLDGATIVPDNSAVKFGRMCQLASSSIVLEDGEDRDGFTRQIVELALPSSKADDLLDFLGDHPEPLVVTCNSPRLVGLCEKKLDAAKITHCKIVGGMSDEDKHAANRLFQDGRCQVIFITSAGSEAIDLTVSPTILFLQPDPSYLSREQKIGRVDRIGQTRPVRVVYSISPGTVEQRLYTLGTEKQERAASVVRDPDLMRWIIGESEPAGAEA